MMYEQVFHFVVNDDVQESRKQVHEEEGKVMERKTLRESYKVIVELRQLLKDLYCKTSTGSKFHLK